MTLELAAVTSRAFQAPARASSISEPAAAYWVLRLGAAFCFIGHGAFGFIAKQAWVPYFGLVGIPESWAYRLMPLVGAVDVMAGMAVLFAPRGLPLVYMVTWALWTALLRPLTGESAFETLERAGNYGVPLALLTLTLATRSRAGLTSLLPGPLLSGDVLARTRVVLRWSTVVLLAGHGALGVTMGNATLPAHYAAIGLPLGTTVAVGWIELVLAAAVILRPGVALLLAVAAWKLATESLFIVAGAPVWEFVERAGSYAAPLALALLVREQQSSGRV